MEASTEAARRGWDADGGRGWGWGEQGERAEEGPCLSLGWLVFYLYPLRVPEIINMCCHSCFSSGDFIQSLQKLRIKSHGFVFWRATLPHTGEFCILWRHVRPATFAEHSSLTHCFCRQGSPFFADYHISFHWILPCPGLLSVSPTHFHAFFPNTRGVQNNLSLSAGQLNTSLTNPPFSK